MYIYQIAAKIYFILFLSTVTAFSQTATKAKHDALGITFTIPENWFGQKTALGFLITSTKTPGFVLILPNYIKDIVTMKSDALKGIQNNNGTSLLLTGNLESLQKDGFAGKYTGTLEWQQIHSFIAGKINPYGNGVTILCATKPNLYSDEHRKTTLQIANSIQFTKPKSDVSILNIDNQWTTRLYGSRLTYMSTYSTYGGGSSSKRIIDLCSKGYFNFSSNYNMTLDTGGTFGSSSDANKGSGTWTVVKSALGESMLQLTFYNGEIYEYIITSDKDDKTFLNGDRYFRTYNGSGKYSPQCD